MSNGPLSNYHFWSSVFKNFASVDIHVPLLLSYFPFPPLICSYISFRCSQACNSGISANEVPWVFDRAFNTCFTCGLKFYSRKLNKQALYQFFLLSTNGRNILRINVVFKLTSPSLLLIGCLRRPSLGFKVSNP